MKVNVIGVPINLGCDRKGVEKAPDHLRRKGLIDCIRKQGHRTYDTGNLYIPEVPENHKFKDGATLKYLETIVEVNNNLAELVYDTLRGNGFPLVIGGDHSLGLGSASGVGKAFDDFGIIWLDAHGDINTHETTPSGNIHGMALGALMGIGSSSLVNIYAPGNKVDPKNVFLVGTRSLDDGELRLIDEEQLSVYPMTEIRRIGVRHVVHDIIRKLQERKIRNVHFSIDIDVLDPDIAPGTGTRVEGGMSMEEFRQFVGGILATHLVKSLDLVEFNTDLDPEDRTTGVVLDIVSFIADNL
ncbi:MAG: arginase [Bacteroidales bacterium]